MASLPEKTMPLKKILVKDLNPLLTCTLCGGYFIDATALVDCLHVFCRGCILRYFENCKQGCPTCNMVYKKKGYSCFRSDPQLQTMVYKLVPGLYSKEMQRREDFYRSTGVRASSSCSDDSVLGDMMQDHEEWVSSYVGDRNQFFSPEDSISLSLEYYQHYLDTTPDDSAAATDATQTPANAVDRKRNGQLNANEVGAKESDDNRAMKKDGKSDMHNDRRYLQCPAAVTMSHLQKFVRMKYALTREHRVDIIYGGEVLPTYFSLMDVAYTFNWSRLKPMRFFYRIFTPMKVRPIKIINTSSGGEKQLQIVPVKPSTDSANDDESTQTTSLSENNDPDSQNYRNKEKLMANLQLQSKSKALENERLSLLKPKKLKTPEPEACVYEYEEPDKEEIKRFAEKRDREWAMQKHLDEQEESRHVSKKRKKNKHSKNESVHKKRKLHAEITSSEVLNKDESLKLKVKLTPHNGHKHKHHKSAQNNNNNSSQSDLPKQQELSSKEKLLQMRAVRHKHISNDEKSVQTVPTASSTTEKQTDKTETPKKEAPKKEVPAPSEIEKKLPKEEIKELPKPQVPAQPPQTKSSEAILSGKTLRSDFSIKTIASRELAKVQPAVHLERTDHMEKQAQKTFLKTAAPNADKYKNTSEKVPTVRVENCKPPTKSVLPIQNINKVQQFQQQNMKALERKLANIKQQCTIEPKNGVNQMQDKRIMYLDKPQVRNNQYPTGFTVSKVESGVKRKLENDQKSRDTRPSLEITLINPPANHQQAAKTPVENKAPVKRPPPATIPLDRIKKSITFNKSGVSIIPKMPERCDNIGALDLSKPHKPIGENQQRDQKVLNGLMNNHVNTSTKDAVQKPTPHANNTTSRMTPKPSTTEPSKNVQLSNLQMLSKVAAEHPTLLKSATPAGQNSTPNNVKPKPQMPNLQTLKIPVPQQTPKNHNLAKIPKLNEIPKGQFRLLNPQVRNMRPNQNQSIRNIPNPSLLVRQQNQNRLNSLATANHVTTEAKEAPKVTSTSNTAAEKPSVTSEPEKKEPSAPVAQSVSV